MFRILFYFCDHKCSSPVSKNTNAGPKTLDDIIDCRQIYYETSKNIAEFILTSNNYFEFWEKVFLEWLLVQNLCIYTKLAPLYECIFTDKIETDFSKMQIL